MNQNLNDISIAESIEFLRFSLEKKGLSSVYIRTYGCQLNLSDSEKIKGILTLAGCSFCESETDADIVVINTCAVRLTAEERVFGHLGRLKEYFTRNKDKLLMLGGCMVEQEHIREHILKTYPFVGIIFSTNNLSKLPELMIKRLEVSKNTLTSNPNEYLIDEDIPIVREQTYRAFIPIMYGCDNYCTYCSVPYVRGNERSRNSNDIISEFNCVIENGYKEVMLLGQNVNSYGKNLEEKINFSELLNDLCSNNEDYRIRFMTSHPKDATNELFEVIASQSKISRSIHLPVQSGSNRILKEMNRNYTAERYMKLIEDARRIISGVTFTSDIIIGFPNETEEDYLDTLNLIKEVRFSSLFVFIYSPREGTKAASLMDNIPHSEKVKRLTELTSIQNDISEEFNRKLLGVTQKAIATGVFDNYTEFRLDNNSIVRVEGAFTVGNFHNIVPNKIINRRLYGEAVS